MRIGVVFPQTELGGDAGAVRAYAQRAGELGFTHVLAYDHVAGADPAVHAGWDGPYDMHTTFHEPMVLDGYLAAVTSMELVTGIIILPQRQTMLAAKQAAEVDLLTGGKFRLGVGIGWNRVEYEALGQDFSTRGRRLEEQITLLRRLWTEQSVTFSGTFDRITGAGLAPMPVQRPIPVWIGAQSPRAYRRAGRLADGWFPQMAPGPQFDQARRIVAEAAAEAGRDPASLGMEGRLGWQEDRDKLAAATRQWQDARATHLSVNTGVTVQVERCSTKASQTDSWEPSGRTIGLVCRTRKRAENCGRQRSPRGNPPASEHAPITPALRPARVASCG